MTYFGRLLDKGMTKQRLICMKIVTACCPMAAMNLESGLPRREEPMHRNIVSERLYSAELRDLRRKLPPPARSVGRAATGQSRGASPAGLLLLLLGVWAASWATLIVMAEVT
jgi:hypothetical protein